MNYAAFKINMAVNDVTSSDTRLLEVGTKPDWFDEVFPQQCKVIKMAHTKSLS